MLKRCMEEKSAIVENALKNVFDASASKVDDSIKWQYCKMLDYPISAGGKRIRPILTLLTCELFGGDYKKAIVPAVSLELIHTYSLVHDDLPAMDNDDMRRGKPTTHIKYGEANAILTGDALLTYAFENLSRAEVDDTTLRKLLIELSRNSGFMVYGQYIDLFYEQKEINFEMLKILHQKKTAALIVCACVMGALVAGTSESNIKAIREYAIAIGLTFQIQDDILDYIADEKELGKTVGKDAKSDKLTYVKQFGLEGAKEQALIVTKKAVEALSKIENANNEIINILIELANYIIERKN